MTCHLISTSHYLYQCWCTVICNHRKPKSVKLELKYNSFYVRKMDLKNVLYKKEEKKENIKKIRNKEIHIKIYFYTNIKHLHHSPFFIFKPATKKLLIKILFTNNLTSFQPITDDLLTLFEDLWSSHQVLPFNMWFFQHHWRESS